jgi:hypothetical protein
MVNSERVEIERNCIRHCFANKIDLLGRRSVAIIFAGFFSKPFSVIVQSVLGKIRPSCISTVYSEEEIIALPKIEPFRLLE